MSETDWMHDDITWCARECPDHTCHRNRVNRRQKKGMFSTGDMYEDGKCPPEASIDAYHESMAAYEARLRQAEGDRKPGIFETLYENDTLRECISEMRCFGDLKNLVKNFLSKTAYKEAVRLMKDAFGEYDAGADVKGQVTYKNLEDLEATAILYGMMFALYDLQGEERPE